MITRYQKQTYYELTLNRFGYRIANVFEYMCELSKYLRGNKNPNTGLRVPPVSRDVDAAVLHSIALYLLPSFEPHTLAYSERVPAWRTEPQYRVDGKVVTWEQEVWDRVKNGENFPVSSRKRTYECMCE